MIRVKAALVHLCICIAIAVLLSAVVFTVWYPVPLDKATGVVSIFLMVLAVDVVIGPLITLIIYNPKKKELKWDLAAIAVLQLGALIYGVSVVYAGRPVYLVFNIDRFDLVQAADLTPEKLKQVRDSRFKSIPKWGAELAVATRPESRAERQELLLDALSGKDDLPYLPKYYMEYSSGADQVKPRIRELDELKALNKTESDLVDGLIDKYEAEGQVGFLPLKAKERDLVVILDRHDASVLEIVDLRPWN